MRTSASIRLLWSLAPLVNALGCRNDPSNPKACLHGDAYITHEGPPVGKEEVYNGVTMYVTGQPSSVVVLYLSDIFGINSTDTKLLADSFGRAGFLTVAPDFFDGHPSPMDLNEPGFNQTQFLAEHGPEVADPIVEKGIRYLKEQKGVTKVVLAGYCYGGRYAFRFAGPEHGTAAAFAAHPSLYTDAEAAGVGAPTVVAAGQDDTLLPPARRYALEASLAGQPQPWSLAVYAGAPHGFAVRANASDPRQLFAKQEAFLQAVRWFQYWA